MSNNNLVAPPSAWYETRASELRAVASTVEPTYPSSAEVLRSIAIGVQFNRPEETMSASVSTRALIIARVAATCLIALMIMGTVKLGMVLFS